MVILWFMLLIFPLGPYNIAMNGKCMEDLLRRIERIHTNCHKLIIQTLGKDLPVAGNIGVFCQSEEEYKKFENVRRRITRPSDDPKQKYFELKEPLVIEAIPGALKSRYTHLYIRKPDLTPFGKYLGDIDFVMEPEEYKIFRKSVIAGEVKGAKLYGRPGWNTVQITDPSINSVAFVSTKEFAEKVRVRFD